MVRICNRFFVKKTIAMSMTIVFVVFSTPVTISASSTQEKIDEAIRAREETEEALENTGEKKEELEAKADNLQVTLNDLNTELTQVSANVEQLEQDIAAKKEEIVQKELELEEAVRIREEQYAAMKLRVQFMYESRDYVFLETLLSSGSLSELLNYSEYVEKLADYDNKKLEEFKNTEQDVAEKRESLYAEQEDLEELYTQVKSEQARVTGLVGATQGAITDFQGQISQVEQEMLAYEQRIKEQNEDIKKWQEQLAEERRLAAEAAKMVWRDISEVTFSEEDRYQLANLIYCEAGNQPYSGQVAVGAVVINRMLSPVFPDTMMGVIYQDRQFSPVASGRMALALAENRATDACYRAADDAMRGNSPVGNCLFFRTPIEGLTGISIGGHIFYGNH